IRDFIPYKIIDIHTHVYRKEFLNPEPANHNVTWPSLVANENPIEDLMSTYKLMFPGKVVTPMIFGNLLNKMDNFEAGNNYVRQVAKKNKLPFLYFSRPMESAGIIEEKIKKFGYLGLKVYLSLADNSISANNITIFDYLPHHHLEVLNQYGAIAMLHIPRSGRLKDPVNLEQMLMIEKNYPNVKLIIAHVGRAYCKQDIGNAFEILRKTKNMMFDISANTNDIVFTELIKAVGTKRILFGSDLPITRMRMKRICEKGRYINIVPHGMYGDISGDQNMRNASVEESMNITFFLYEEIAAFRRAAEKMKLTSQDIEDVFYNNAKRLL
ncbi:MAG: amidohydrolase family protein, partial [Chlorobi bacterium]|nr:amidohydrolase family protein [Chlorobiota bacterium]